MATTRVWGARAVTSLLCVAALMGACGGSDDSIGEPAANSESSAANPVAQADGDAEITAATEPTTSAASVPDRVVSSYSLAHGAQDQPGCSAGLVWYNGIPELQAGLAAGDAERVRTTSGLMRDAMAELAFAQLPADTAGSIEFGKLLASGLLANVDNADPDQYDELLVEMGTQLGSEETQNALRPLADYFSQTCGLGTN